MSTQRPAHLSYLLRLWQAPGETEQPWRASLENPLTGERRGFADLEAALAYLRTQVLTTPPPDEESGGERVTVESKEAIHETA